MGSEFRYRYGPLELRSCLLARIPVLREFGTMGAYYPLCNVGRWHATSVYRNDLGYGSRSFRSES